MSVVDQLLERARGQKDVQAKSYLQLIEQVADGVVTDPAAVEDVLQDSGRTPEGLAADVERLLHRRALAAQVKLAAGNDAGHEKIEQERAKLTRILEQAQRDYQAGMYPLAARERELATIAREAHAAEAELIRTAGDELKAKQARLALRCKTLDEKREPIKALIERNRVIVQDLEPHLGRGTNDAELQKEIANAEHRTEQHRQALAALDAEMKVLDNEGRAITAEMIEP